MENNIDTIKKNSESASGVEIEIETEEKKRTGYQNSPIKNESADDWLEKIISSLSHFLLFIGMTIITSLIVGLFMNIYQSS